MGGYLNTTCEDLTFRKKDYNDKSIIVEWEDCLPSTDWGKVTVPEIQFCSDAHTIQAVVQVGDQEFHTDLQEVSCETEEREMVKWLNLDGPCKDCLSKNNPEY